MAPNLVSLAMKFLTPDMVLKLAQALGLDRAIAQKAIGAAVPAILGAIVGKAAKPDGAKALSDLIGKQDPGLLGNLAGMLGGANQGSLISSGTSALTSLLGSTALGSLSSAVTKFTGAADGASKGLLGVLGPIVLGTIGQEQRSAKLDATGLASLLSGQKDNVAAALPGDFAKLLGGTGLLDAIPGMPMSAPASTTAASAAKPAATAARPTTTGTSTAAKPAAARPGTAASTSTRPAPSMPWWQLPLLAAVLLGLGWTFFGGSAPRSVTPPLGAQRVAVDGVDVTSQLSGTVDLLRTTLTGIKDAGTAQAAVPRLQEAAAQLDRVSGLAARMTPEGRKALAAVVATALGSLDPLFNRVLQTPGVGAVVKPTIDSLRAKLEVLAKA